MSTTTNPSPPKKMTTKVAVASFIGTTIEGYDFVLYGLAAATVFGPLFFAPAEPLVGTIAAFATYAVGFVARPVGGILGGHFGDRIGRKTVLVASLLLTGLATTAIGLLPIYAQIGWVAPVLLLLLRVLQGIGYGAEWAGAALMTVEHAKPKRRGLTSSATQLGPTSGMLLATGVLLVLENSMTNEQFLAWGWRIPFVASLLLVAVGLVIRLSVEDSAEFKRVQQVEKVADRPVLESIKTHPRQVALTTGLRIAQNAFYYVYTVFILTYLTQVSGTDRNTGLAAVLIASALGLVTVPLWGWLSDVIGRRRVYLFGAISSAVAVIPFFWLLDSGVFFLIVLGVVFGLNVGHDAMYGPQAAFFSELFSTRVRFSGVSLGYQLGSVLGGGLAPLVATALLAAGGGNPVWVIVYFLGVSAITIIATLKAPETKDRPLSGNAQADAQPELVSAP
ncbi:MFS transporter [Arthrobacter crystallopoietes]|uniref:Metabolite-proton symporter n=1 Tax=Crystallibacter crystallopoietes TaxID=37928 RepID=A0A1H1C8F2_9MICC|nr:MFS transporter [Arthrobacter crystallopoietes]AUI50837.1 MFS transporter [Arthrobacter crystallopoietes]SDQ60350.1 metabolite-proton symporter [Arthrobacter crystallopoietes]